MVTNATLPHSRTVRCLEPKSCPATLVRPVAKLRAEAEGILRDLAFVYQLTRSIKEQITAAPCLASAVPV
jgi:hypothetical protein